MSAFSSAILQSRQNLYIFIVKFSNLQGPASLPPLPSLSPISHSFSSLPPIFFIQISPIMKFNAFFLLHYFFLIFFYPFHSLIFKRFHFLSFFASINNSLSLCFLLYYSRYLSLLQNKGIFM